LPTVDARIRSCERLFARGKFQRRCKPGFSHVKGTGFQLRRAGFESAQQLESFASVGPLAKPMPQMLHSLNIVEAFPNAFLGLCVSDEQYSNMPILRRGRKFDWLYDEWCKTGRFHTLFKEVSSIPMESFALICGTNRDHEERAALICLATAAAVATGRYTAVGEPTAGYFFLPPWFLWADWARTELNFQRRAETSLEVWIDGVRFSNEMRLP
jgi:hypothetical protein